MGIQDLNQIDNFYFSTDEISRVLSISKDSARVAASRYAKKNVITRCKRDLYILTSRIPFLTEEELFQLANLIQTPSYVSLTSALAYYNLTTQQPREFIESIALKRTQIKRVASFEFSYNLVKTAMYKGFVLKNNFFIAEPEKALADCIYLTALKRYNCDFDGIHFENISRKKVSALLDQSNMKTLSLWGDLCRTYKL